MKGGSSGSKNSDRHATYDVNTYAETHIPGKSTLHNLLVILRLIIICPFFQCKYT